MTCWAGGTNVWNKTDWTPLAGREVSLWADGDPLNKQKPRYSPGHKAMQGLAAHLHGLGCKVRIALPPVEWDSDVADWIAEGGPAGAAQILAGLLTDYEPPPDDDELLEMPTNGLEHNPHYRLWGLVGTSLVFSLRVALQPEIISRRDISSANALIAIAPLEWWCSLDEHDKITVEMARRFGSSLIRLADAKGQVDMSKQVGRGAVRMDDGSIAYHLGNRLLIDGDIRALQDDDSRMWLSEPALAYGDEASTQHTVDMAQAIMGYRWATPDDGRRFLGWMVIALVGGALRWRPHLLMTAPAAYGKTWMLDNVLTPILGNAVTKVSNATQAAISRLNAYSSLPVVIDEAEPSEDWVLELLKTLRAASSDSGGRIRATADGGVSFQQAKFCALLSSTVAPSLGKADYSRLSPVGFGPSVANWPKVSSAILDALQHADAVRYRIFRQAAQIVEEVDRLTKEMQGLGMDSREAMSSAALTAGWRFWGLDTKEVHAQPESTGQTDAGDALLEIMSLRVRLPSGNERSVLQLLAEENEADAPILADLMGVRRDGQGLMIAAKHRGLARALARSKWGNADLRKLLLQLDMTVLTAHPQRFGGLRERAVRIPQATLAEMGVELDDAEPPDKPTDWEHAP